MGCCASSIAITDDQLRQYRANLFRNLALYRHHLLMPEAHLGSSPRTTVHVIYIQEVINKVEFVVHATLHVSTVWATVDEVQRHVMQYLRQGHDHLQRRNAVAIDADGQPMDSGTLIRTIADQMLRLVSE